MVRVSSPAKLRPWSELTAKMVMGVVPGLVTVSFHWINDLGLPFCRDLVAKNFHSETVDFVMDFCVNFFCGFLRAFRPFKRKDRKSTEKSTANSRQIPEKCTHVVKNSVGESTLQEEGPEMMLGILLAQWYLQGWRAALSPLVLQAGSMAGLASSLAAAGPASLAAAATPKEEEAAAAPEFQA